MSPSEQIVYYMSRIYAGGMTTTSGGNISMRAEDDGVWITPSGVDKGTLQSDDVVRLRPDGSVEGPHRPSSEYPSHRAVYERRPDLRALIHAHPPALVAFSIVRRTPDVQVMPQARHVCGSVGYAPYELPGSEALGRRIADAFAAGHDAVIMENHGTLVGGRTLDDAFQRFETLELCARTIIKASRLGDVVRLSDDDLQRYEAQDNRLPELADARYTEAEEALREDVCRFVHRACAQGLMISTYGTISVRTPGGFVITPTDVDRRRLQPEDVVVVREGRRSPGALPSRAVRLHARIYRNHPGIGAVVLTQPPNAMAFCITGRSFDTRTIPESYVLLRDVPRVPFLEQFGEASPIPELISPASPILFLQNNGLLVTGRTLLEAFDRVEVAEFSARSLVDAGALGEMVPISEEEIDDLKRRFL